MSYSNSFPTQRPSLNLVFNGGSDQLDSRISFSRADSTPSAVHYWSNEKHESSQNLIKQSQSYDTTWTSYQLASSGGLTGSQAAPDGTSTAWLMTAGTLSPGAPFLNQVLSGISSSTEYTVSAYLKAGTASHAYISLRAQYGHIAWAEIDFANPLSPSSGGANFTGISASSTAVGSTGWYRLTLTCTTSTVTVPSTYVGPSDGTDPSLYGYAVWNCSGESIYVWGHQIEERGSATVYNATTSQIHRSYSSTLKSVTSAGDPRFEYSPADGQSDAGSPLGLLVESQASNLYPNSSDMTGDSGYRVNVDSNVAIGPTGGLTADALRLDANDASQHYRQYNFTAAASTAYTFSVYVKAAGLNYIAVRSNNLFASNFTYFNLSNGTVEGSPAMTSTIESVGNGWHRISVNATTTGAGTASFIVYIVDTSVQSTVTTGDSYRAVLGTGIQIEASSAPSSLISTSGSTATRSADSCSVATADFGFTGGQVSIVAETEAGDGTGNNPRLFNLNDGSDTTRLMLYKNSASADNTVAWTAYYGASGMGTLSGSNNSSKVAVSVDTSDFAATSDTGTLLTNATGSQHEFSQLYIGSNYNGTAHQLNGHVKRLSLFNVALSDTELAALVD